ncbi:MAG: UbiX family flavin prenyltransferase [Magnetococcales bacterium]|nr:UbiX family flavin prenyltransferase [Magnetococcales bacterium]
MDDQPITVAMTGASGMGYGVRLVSALLELDRRVDLLLSDAARTVLEQELDLDWRGDVHQVSQIIHTYFDVDGNQLRYFGKDDWFAPQASGSGGRRSMVICPCSMGSLASIAQGLSENLIERAADVALKERFPLILVTRETPLSAIHLRNMLTLNEMGAILLPASPGFYHKPQSIEALIDFMVGRILDQLNISHQLLDRWGA